ncbi:MAG: prepilin-type N-terminal cleavage/methylation domain-containing protein [bacterium]|nr:prepilin-type N-terminal cleavage/methylation domain-containing protein [bacterium]
MIISKKDRGFTILEMLVVIVIMGLISGVVVGIFSGFRNKAYDIKRLSDVEQITTALFLYYKDYGHFPCHSWMGSTQNDGSTDPEWLLPLYEKGYLTGTVQDPEPSKHDYEYWTFHNPGSSSCGQYVYLSIDLDPNKTECPAGTYPADPLGSPGECHILYPRLIPCSDPTLRNTSASTINDCTAIGDPGSWQ